MLFCHERKNAGTIINAVMMSPGTYQKADYDEKSVYEILRTTQTTRGYL